MKHKHLLIIAFFAVSNMASAQSVRQEMKANPCVSASEYLAYPGPKQKNLTPAPAGYKPFYISHYGRHGSRYFIQPREYALPLATLSRADSLGKLTEIGKEVLRKARLMNAEAHNRLGELTLLGAQQHEGIAQRMAERFPEVFADSAYVDARSTIIIRCIISMESALQRLLRINPKLKVSHDASYHDMYYLNRQAPDLLNLNPTMVMTYGGSFYTTDCSKSEDTDFDKAQWTPELKAKYEQWEKGVFDPAPLMKRIFNDEKYAAGIDGRAFANQLFRLAGVVQESEIRKQITPLYDIFTDDEIYQLWTLKNVSWYCSYGHCPLNGGTQPFRQGNLLRNIISQADSCMALPTHGATLRFGHETCLLPLACLLGLNGCDQRIESFDDIEKSGWVNYRVFPMGSNIQFIFYRRSATDKNPLVKVLLNENEATLPVKSDTKPYYRWSDVKPYYLNKLAAAGY